MAEESDGAKCVFVEGAQIPLIVQKSDGGFGYASTDMAAGRHVWQGARGHCSDAVGRVCVWGVFGRWLGGACKGAPTQGGGTIAGPKIVAIDVVMWPPAGTACCACRARLPRHLPCYPA